MNIYTNSSRQSRFSVFFVLGATIHIVFSRDNHEVDHENVRLFSLDIGLYGDQGGDELLRF